MASQLFLSFVLLKIAKLLIETWLSVQNRAYYSDLAKQAHAKQTLGISDAEFAKIFAYTEDKYKFHFAANWIQTFVLLGFIAFGGFLSIEECVLDLAQNRGFGSLGTGLLFWGSFGLLNFFYSLPFDLYQTFKIEEKHGFNRQTPKGFFADKVKELIISILLGGALLGAVLWAMESGPLWWLGAWILTASFGVLVSWLYPTFLAPLFNKFNPLPEGELRDKIYALAEAIGFKAGGISVMDASRRSSHGNAYFTGVFGEKKIVLFDTLIQSLTPQEIVAVLAHELGHFKLHHVRISLIQSIVTMGLLFYVLSLLKPMEDFYHAFGFEGVSNYAALIVFGLWYSIVGFLFNPLQAWLSQRNEFAADAFAKKHLGTQNDLTHALTKLQKSNQSMPLVHPTFSRFYYSHPPLLQRLEALDR